MSAAVYWAYLTHAMGGWHVPLLIGVQLLWQALQIGSDWWLAAYTSESSASGPDPVTPGGFLWLYSLLALGSALFVFLRTAVIAWAGVSTAQAFFRGMLRAVFRAPMAFFDSTPVGRILSRVRREGGVAVVWSRQLSAGYTCLDSVDGATLDAVLFSMRLPPCPLADLHGPGDAGHGPALHLWLAVGDALPAAGHSLCGGLHHMASALCHRAAGLLLHLLPGDSS